MLIPAGARGLDYAFGRPTPDSILRNGYTFVVRYLSVPPASSKKNITLVELDGLLAAGIGVLLVWEMSADSANGGAVKGTAHGQECKRLLRGISYPANVPIIVAVDTDTWAPNIDAHEAYVRAFHRETMPYLLAVYGDSDILLRTRDISRMGWLPNASAWSTNTRAAAMAAGVIHVLQRKGYGMEGVAVDPNDVIQPIRVWSNQTLPPVPPVLTEVPDMDVIVTNSEELDSFWKPGTLQLLLLENGFARHLDGPEYEARTHGWTSEQKINRPQWDNATIRARYAGTGPQAPPVFPQPTECRFPEGGGLGACALREGGVVDLVSTGTLRP